MWGLPPGVREENNVNDAREKVAEAIKAAVNGNVAVFYPCQCDEHESGYDHFVDQLATALVTPWEARS